MAHEIKPKDWARRLLAGAEEAVERNRKRVSEEFQPKIARFAARLPFAEDFVAAYYAAFDEKTPPRVRATLLGALAYFIMPMDFLPDFIVGLGFTDDLTVLATALGLIRGHMTPEHREAARQALDRAANPAEPH